MFFTGSYYSEWSLHSILLCCYVMLFLFYYYFIHFYYYYLNLFTISCVHVPSEFVNIATCVDGESLNLDLWSSHRVGFRRTFWIYDHLTHCQRLRSHLSVGPSWTEILQGISLQARFLKIARVYVLTGLLVYNNISMLITSHKGQQAIVTII